MTDLPSAAGRPIAALYRLSGLADPMVAPPAPTPGAELALLQLRALNHRFVHEALDPHGALLEASTAADFLHTRADGQWIERADFIAHQRRQPAPGDAGLRVDSVRLFGRVALVQGCVIGGPTDALAAARPDGARLRFLDVYRWQGAAWQRVSAQDTPLRANVPLALQHGLQPVPAAGQRWTGQDPEGDENRVLHTLNDHYVRAFRESDVAWYDAHLSDDYVVISSDGSLNDRTTALAHFARPTFATSMRSFPVAQVRVRRFDDVALIHAENDYELLDGRRGVSRYTDIWVKGPTGTAAGAQPARRWRCVAAHITVHRVPA